MHPHDLPQPSPEAPPKRAWFTSSLRWVAGVVVGLVQFVILFSFLGASPAVHYTHNWQNIVYACIGLCLALNVLSTWWHELGHYLAARLAGDQLVVFAAWPLAIYPDWRGWRASYFSHKDWGGFVSTTAPWPVRRRGAGKSLR